jgi:competence protein ComQ
MTDVGLQGFLERVDERVQGAIASARCPASQRRLLAETARVLGPRSSQRLTDDPLAMTYLIARRVCRLPNEQAEQAGAFVQLYRLAANLFDDVEDDDLAQTPHASVGGAVATNDALALLCLGLCSLTRVIELEADATTRLEYLRLFNEVSVSAVGGQHLDLSGSDGVRTPDEVLAMHQAKASSLRLLTELGALLAGYGQAERAVYRGVGEHLAVMVQIRDDLRDIFGTRISSDLVHGKLTYPVACFCDTASQAQRTRFRSLCVSLPDTTGEVRALLHAAGAVQRSAEVIESCRREVHSALATLSGAEPERRMLLSVVDALAESVYTPPRIEASAGLWSPRGPWHELVRREMASFMTRMAPWGPPDPAELRPWHLPQWMYDPRRRIIFYPDIEGLAEETLPFHAGLLGIRDLAALDSVFREQVPALLAHEMFHLWRHEQRRLTRDCWHEDWVANRLALAYVRQYDPASLTRSLELADRALSGCRQRLDGEADRLLSRCATPDPDRGGGYAMPLEDVAIFSLEMVRRLSRCPETLEQLMVELLERRSEGSSLTPRSPRTANERRPCSSRIGLPVAWRASAE